MAADTVTVIWLLRNQIQQSKSEDLLGFTHESAAVHLQLQGCSEGFYKLQDFYRKKGGARELLAKEKKRLFLSWAIFLSGGEFLSCRLPLLPLGADGEHLVPIDKKIPDRLLEIKFLGEVESIIQ